MTGLDGKIALLKMVRANLFDKQEKLTANDEIEAAQAFYARQAFAFARA